MCLKNTRITFVSNVDGNGEIKETILKMMILSKDISIKLFEKLSPDTAKMVFKFVSTYELPI